MAEFAQLGLKKEILTLVTQKFKHPLEVQEKIIPLALQGKNLVFTSRTGSGKTMAYFLGYVGKINTKLGLQMLVLVPTRELCVQVGKEMQQICQPLEINVGTLYGGRDLAGDHRTTQKKNHIIVATPGRLIQHINEKNIKVGEVKYLVFDESDQMFDEGFFHDCEYVRSRVSRTAQLILASATITAKVASFIETMGEHEFLAIGEQIPSALVQEKLYCEKSAKQEILLTLFQQKKVSRAMVFCNTKIKSAQIADFLNTHRIHSKVLNGDLPQQERLNMLNLFKAGKIPVLITTDVAARGLHIEHVGIIINYDAPTRAEFYVHRIGRTARGTKHGYALTLICPEDVERFQKIETLYKLKIKEIKNFIP